MSEPKRIGRFEQTDPVHAQCDMPRFDFRSVVGIEFGRMQSTTMDSIHLGTDIEFGTVDLMIEGQPYTLSLASALIRLEKTNANIMPGSKYRHILSGGEIEAHSARSRQEARGHALAVGAAGGTDGAAAGKAKGGWFRSGGKASKADVRIKHEVALVTTAGQDAWRAGGEAGHPFLETGDLRGTIVNSYRGDQATPLCTLEAVDPSQSIRGRIRIQASATDFRLKSKRQQNPAALPSIREGLRKDQRAYATRAEQSETTLKEQVALLALLMPARGHADDGMLDLAERGFVFSPEPDPEPEPGTSQ